MVKKTPTEAHADEAKKQDVARARYAEDVKESQAEVARELIPCPVCGAMVQRGDVCAVDGNAAPDGSEKPAL